MVNIQDLFSWNGYQIVENETYMERVATHWNLNLKVQNWRWKSNKSMPTRKSLKLTNIAIDLRRNEKLHYRILYCVWGIGDFRFDCCRHQKVYCPGSWFTSFTSLQNSGPILRISTPWPYLEFKMEMINIPSSSIFDPSNRLDLSFIGSVLCSTCPTWVGVKTTIPH
jgi:hypothetical protein